MASTTVISVADNIMVQVLCTFPGQIASTLRNWVVESIVGAGSVTFGDIATAMDSDFAPLYKALLCNPASYYGVAVRRFAPVLANPDSWAYSKANTGIGTAGAIPLATQSTGLLHITTTKLKGRGRVYLPFPSASDAQADGTATAGYLTRANALGTYLSGNVLVVNGATTATLRPVIYVASSAAFLPVDTVTARDAWATQQRRGSFGALNALPW